MMGGVNGDCVPEVIGVGGSVHTALVAGLATASRVLDDPRAVDERLRRGGM